MFLNACGEQIVAIEYIFEQDIPCLESPSHGPRQSIHCEQTF